MLGKLDYWQETSIPLLERTNTAEYTVCMELVLVLFLALLFTLINGLHVLIPFVLQPPNTLFTGIAHYYEDYFFYVSHIVDGMKGSLLVSQRFTNEPLPKLWVYWFNALLGYIGKWFTQSPFAIYNVSLFFLILGLIIAWYILIRAIFPRSPILRILALLFILSATNMYDIGLFFFRGTVMPLGAFWFSPAPALNRLGGAPHHAIQSILIIMELLLLHVLLNRKNGKHYLWQWIVYGIVSVWLTSMNPMQMLLLILAGGLICLGDLVKKAYLEKHIPSMRFCIQHCMPVVFMGILALPIALLLTRQFISPLYANAQQWEYSQYVPVSIQSFIQAVGISAIFLPFALLPAITIHKSRLLLLSALYLGVAQFFFWSPLPGLFHASRVRFLHPINYGLISLFSAIGFLAVVQYGAAALRRMRFPYSIRTAKILVGIVFLSLYLMGTVPTLVVQTKERTDPAYASLVNKSPLNHVPIGVAQALQTLDGLDLGNTPVVVTDPILPYDTLIPASTGKTSFTGHILHTMYGSTKQALRLKLFSQSTTIDEAKTIMRNHRIGALFVSAHPKNRPDLTAHYPFLRQSFANNDILIFTIRD